MHVDQPDLLTPAPHVVGDHRRVGDGIGVGHREDRGEPAERSCRRAGFDVLGVFATRLAQVGVQVHEAGQQHLPAHVDDLGVTGHLQPSPDRGDLSVVDLDVDLVALAVEPNTSQQNRHALIAPSSAPTSRWNNTAIRTCTPLETCCSTADCGESATE